MENETRNNLILSPRWTRPDSAPAGFAGFAAPSSNTTYTPNQFFDVCLPVASRGCVRIVAYLIRKTLGWCDSQGNPQREQIEVGYGELERKAGVSHDMIRQALDEAISLHFIEAIRRGRAKSAGDAGDTALYALKWDATPRYARTKEDFRGFYEGDGHRTDIPNQYFDIIIPRETLAVTRVVGAVIRYSIGFQAKHGRRRQQATLSYGQILKVSGLSSRRTLAGAIREAIGKNFIVRLDPGYFSANVCERRSATYAVRWSDGFHADPSSTPLTPPDITPKRIPAGLWITRSEKDTSGAVDHSDTATRNTPKRIPAGHSEKDTIEIKHLNETQKQAPAVDLLRKEGFDVRAAGELAARHPLEVIRRQIGWLPERNPTKSRIGLLRRAIEGDWGKPGRAPATAGTGQQPSRPDTPESAHYQKHSPAYFQWLVRQERDYRRECPSDYGRFEAKRDRRRADLRMERSTLLRGSLLARHDSDEGRLGDFQKFLGVPDFWQWDESINSQPFHQRT